MVLSKFTFNRGTLGFNDRFRILHRISASSYGVRVANGFTFKTGLKIRSNYTPFLTLFNRFMVSGDFRFYTAVQLFGAESSDLIDRSLFSYTSDCFSDNFSFLVLIDMRLFDSGTSSKIGKSLIVREIIGIRVDQLLCKLLG